MHLFFGMRGILHQTEIFKIFMQAQMFPWRRRRLSTNVIETVQVQGSLRECMGGIYEYVFPEECLEEVLTMLGITNNLTGSGEMGRFKKFIIRNILGNGIEPIPTIKPVNTLRYIDMKGIILYPIGIKKDLRVAVKEWDFEQEML